MERSTSEVGALAAAVGWRGERATPGPDWDAVTGHLGLRLPADYVELASTFPPGTFNDALRLIQPYPARPPERYRTSVENAVELLRLGLEFSEVGEVPLYPEPGGLLPWGLVDFAWTFAWRTTAGDPGEWGSVVVSNDLDFLYDLEGSVTRCVLNLVTGRTRVREESLLTDENPVPAFAPLPPEFYPD